MAPLPAWSKALSVVLFTTALVLVLSFRGSDGPAAPVSAKRTSLRSALATLPGRLAAGEVSSRPLAAKDTRSKATAEEVAALLGQVGRELAPWRESGITLEMVERAYCTEEIPESMRIQVINGSVFLVGPTDSYQTRARATQLQLAGLQARFALPDVDLLLTTSDRCKAHDAPHRSHDGDLARCSRTAPLLTNGKLPWESHCVTVPDFAFGSWPEAFLPDWRHASYLMAAAAERRPWEQRTDKVFWRGADTDRQRAVLAGSELVQSSGRADVRLMGWGDADAFKRDFTSLADHCDFRYLLHLRGVGYSSRLKFLLLCGSAMVFPHAGQDEPAEFWHHLLRHGQNVLLTESVSEGNQGAPVLDAVDALRGNDSWARSLGAAARHLAAEVLHPDNVDLYWLELLSQYSALQRFTVTRHADAVPLETALLRPERTCTVAERTCLVC